MLGWSSLSIAAMSGGGSGPGGGCGTPATAASLGASHPPLTKLKTNESSRQCWAIKTGLKKKVVEQNPHFPGISFEQGCFSRV